MDLINSDGSRPMGGSNEVYKIKDPLLKMTPDTRFKIKFFMQVPVVIN